MKRAVVLGGAACVWDDLARAQELCAFDAVIAVNDAGAVYAGELEIWATLHPEKMAGWADARQVNGLPPARIIAAHDGNTQEGRRNRYPVDLVVDYRWPGVIGSGSSVLFAVKVALGQGFERVVVCGAPMNSDPHFFDGQPWKEADGFYKDWQDALPHIRGNVRSMSGRTMELLGLPTRQWLYGAE